MFDLCSWFLGQHIIVFWGLLFTLGLMIGIFGTLLVQDCMSNDDFDEMDEIPGEKEKEEFVVCWNHCLNHLHLSMSVYDKNERSECENSKERDLEINNRNVMDNTQLFFKLLAFRFRRLRWSNAKKFISLSKVPSPYLK